MRPRVSWMTGNDDTILEFFADSEVALPPTGLEINLNREGVDISYSTVHRRLKELHERGLLDKIDEDKGYYAISEKGRAYLDGSLDAADLEDGTDD